MRQQPRERRREDWNLQSMGGRRFLLACASLVSASVLQWFGKLDVSGTAYGLTIGSTVAAFIAGNVVENKNAANARKDKEE